MGVGIRVSLFFSCASGFHCFLARHGVFFFVVFHADADITKGVKRAIFHFLLLFVHFNFTIFKIQLFYYRCRSTCKSSSDM